MVPFTLDKLDCRGRVVRLGEALDAILTRHNYPAPVARLLGEAVVLAALIGSSLKFEGALHPADPDRRAGEPDRRRSRCARRLARLCPLRRRRGEPGDRRGARPGPASCLGRGHLAMTVDQGVHMDRYQGIVALEGGTLEDVAHTYFQQSEQIPTLVRLAVAAALPARATGAPHWRAGGALVQYLPPHGQSVMPDLPGDGDFANPETADQDFVEDDKWTETKSLLSTLADDELADPDLSAERLLFRLYPRDRRPGVRADRARGTLHLLGRAHRVDAARQFLRRGAAGDGGRRRDRGGLRVLLGRLPLQAARVRRPRELKRGPPIPDRARTRGP